MGNSFATHAATEIAKAQKSGALPALDAMASLLAAIHPINPLGLKRALDSLKGLLGSQMRSALVLLPDDILQVITLALASAGQRRAMLDTIEWVTDEQYFAWRYKPRSHTWEETVWQDLTDAITALRGDRRLESVQASKMLDEVGSVVDTLGDLVKEFGPDRPRARLPRQAQSAAMEVLLSFIQPIFEAGVRELGQAQPPATLRQLHGRIEALVQKHAHSDPVFSRFTVEREGRHAMIHDAFPPARARTYPVVNFSLSDDSLPDAPKVSPATVLLRRQSQIKDMLALYGQPMDPKARLESWEQARQRSVAAADKPIDPLDHEGIVRLLALVFLEAHDAAIAQSIPGPVHVAWVAACDALRLLVGVLTAHPGFDLDDDGPNYLTTPFPRTLGGEQLHDCAVYAVRTAFWLHALGARVNARRAIDLKISSRLVTLPVHLALVIAIDPDGTAAQPDKVHSGGLAFVNNHHLDLIEPTRLDGMFSDWRADRPAGDADPTDKAQLRTKFYDDLAAGRFIPSIDMPVSGTPFIGNVRRIGTGDVWKAYGRYRAFAGRNDLFAEPVYRPASAHYEFYLRYLLVLQSRARFVNAVMIERLWRTTGPSALKGALAANKGHRWPSRDVVKRYIDLPPVGVPVSG